MLGYDNRKYTVRVHARTGSRKWVYEETVRKADADTALAIVVAHSGIPSHQIRQATVEEVGDG